MRGLTAPHPGQRRLRAVAVADLFEPDDPILLHDENLA